jgi:rubredoxin-NAD+ reductase
VSPLVILGTGHAGYALAREWRRLDADTPLLLITQDDGASYYKPDLSKAFAAGKDADALVKATAADLARELKADIRTNTAVTRIDPSSHRIFLGGDEAATYGKLVLAVGAEPIRVPMLGEPAAALPVNNRADYAQFRAQLTPGCRVLIIGAGLIGCEFANDLAAAGFRVTVVDVATRPLARFLPQQCGETLQNALAQIGVSWRLGVSVSTLRAPAGGPKSATLTDGSTIEADVVLSAVGLRPNIALAKAAGLACGIGVTVNEMMRTSAPDIYALGDCAEIAGRSLPFILPIANAVRALAPTLAGTPTPAKFPAMPTPVKTPACPVVICPPASSKGEWTVTGAAPDLEAVFIDEAGAPSGFALLGKATAKRGALAAGLPALT